MGDYYWGLLRGILGVAHVIPMDGGNIANIAV